MAKVPRSFNYQRRSAEDVKARANMRGGQFDSYIKDGCKVYKVKEGKNVVRFLPPTWDNARHYGYDIWVNYSIGSDNQSYLSLIKMKNSRDPLAEAKKLAERDGDEDLAKQLTPKLRVCAWVIDRMAEDEGPQLWPAPYTIDKDVANLCLDEDTGELLEIDNPENGNDLRFYREGSGPLTKYPASKMKLLAPSPLSEDVGTAQEWLDYITSKPVPSCLMFYDYAHIASVFSGGTADQTEKKPETKPRLREEPEPEPEEDEPQAAPPKAAGRFRARPEPEPEPELDLEPEPEPEPKPTGRRRSFEPDDEPEPEPEPAPTTRRRPAPVDDELEPEEEEPVEVAAPQPRRRGRAAEPEPEAEPELSGPAIRERLNRRTGRNP